MDSLCVYNGGILKHDILQRNAEDVEFMDIDAQGCFSPYNNHGKDSDNNKSLSLYTTLLSKSPALSQTNSCIIEGALPDELFQVVFSYLSTSDMVNVACTCREWLRRSRDQHLWLGLARHAWQLPSPCFTSVTELDWIEYYRENMAFSRKGAMWWGRPPLSSGTQALLSRYRHTACAVPGRQILLIGGTLEPGALSGDVLLFNVDRNAIVRPFVSGIPANFVITRHTAVFVPRKGVFIFGGSDSVQNGESAKTNKVHLLDVTSYVWYHNIQTTGDIPQPRSDHACASVGTNMYIFGGSNQNIVPLSDLHVLDTNTLTWRLIRPRGASPSARSACSMVAIGTKVFLYGGAVWDRAQRWTHKSNQMFVFDTETETWHLPQTGGIAPAVSTFPTMFSFKHHLFVLFGGSLVGSNVTDEGYVLDTVSMRWSRADVAGPMPEARDCVSVGVVGDTVYLIGGYRGTPVNFLEVLHMDWVKELTWSGKVSHAPQHQRVQGAGGQ